MFGHLPLTALRAFEAAARLKSFKLAADELGVTHTAISHQVRLLERDVGVMLFQRLPRRVAPSAAGYKLYDRVHEALLNIAQIMDKLGAEPGTGALSVSTTPAFAALWLMPRLAQLRAAHPQLQLRIEASVELVDLLSDRGTDMAIRYNPPSRIGLQPGAQFHETFGAYGAPAAVAASARKRPTLLAVKWQDARLDAQGWRRWCELAGVSWQSAPMPAFEHEHQALQAAIAGQGLVLASSVLAADSVQAGLLQPCRPEIRMAGGCYAVLTAPGSERHPPMQALLDWLAGQALASGAVRDERAPAALPVRRRR
ncbi:LysR substrate-binding domain-containing protein [Orrella sp. JC864]|uniref:LysR substrate-binding domain-containing protein n=1 Tax=Orrella sp. JC864 TaxID=3120298 RepID=UPI003008FA0C